jgi:hypothetical protein
MKSPVTGTHVVSKKHQPVSVHKYVQDPPGQSVVQAVTSESPTKSPVLVGCSQLHPTKPLELLELDDGLLELELDGLLEELLEGLLDELELEGLEEEEEGLLEEEELEGLEEEELELEELEEELEEEDEEEELEELEELEGNTQQHDFLPISKSP